jgi:predicted nucleic acid-binding protein
MLRPDAARLFPSCRRDAAPPVETLLKSLSVYDASYLELAQRVALPLATLDTELARTARAEGVSILDGDNS